jgi:hypothetical protein
MIFPLILAMVTLVVLALSSALLVVARRRRRPAEERSNPAGKSDSERQACLDRANGMTSDSRP